jgi:hypothetical protein
MILNNIKPILLKKLILILLGTASPFLISAAYSVNTLITELSFSEDSLKKIPFIIPEKSGDFKFDGIIDDKCWDQLTPLNLTMHIPTFGNEPTEKSEVFICHDNEYVYAAGRFFDKEADKINVTSRMRDNISPPEDGFFLIFDTFHDHENAVVFHTNAAGVREDMTIARDGSEQFPWNNTWNTFWDVKTTMDSLGWYMEMRIPLSSLRFKENNGKVEMGLIALRYIPRKFEIDIYPAIPRDWGFWSFIKPSQGKEIEMEGVHSKTPFYIAPYVTAGLNQESKLNTEGTAYNMEQKPKLSGGLDVKYGLTSNLTADLTINTDFAQVESDQAQINLTRFSLFFPEKRMFFMERASNFEYGYDGMNTLFYSRQIGLHEGRAVPIIAGARLVGRAGPWDIGFLDMQTQAYKTKETDGTDLPSENFGVLRMRRQVFNQNSYVGGVLTSRMGTNGTYNEVAGLDGIINLFGNDYLDVKYAQSFDEKYQNKALSLDASRIWFDWQRRSKEGLGYDFFYSRAGERYEPDMGFEFRKNYYMSGTKLNYGIISKEGSKVSTQTFSLNGQFWKDNGTNITQSAVASAGYSIELKSSAGMVVNMNHAYDFLADTFYLSNDAVIAYVPSGSYNYNFATVYLHTPYTNNVYFEATSNMGGFYDGNQITTRLAATFKFGAFLSLSPSYEYDRIRFPSRSQTFDGQIAGVNAILMFSNKLSLSTQVQYSNIAHGMVTNIRLRYNPKEGNDLYIVFNEGRNIQLDRVYPSLNPVANRGVLLKYTYTFIL